MFSHTPQLAARLLNLTNTCNGSRLKVAVLAFDAVFGSR